MASTSSAASTGSGSARTWVFTINNPESPLDFSDKEAVRYCVYQEETGENGTRHYQGYLELTRTHTLNMLKKLKGFERAHFEQRRGSRDQARQYAMKEDTRVAGPWEHGVWVRSGQGNRTDLDTVRRSIAEGPAIWTWRTTTSANG